MKAQLYTTCKMALSKAASRKLLVFIIATHMAYFGILDSDGWLMIAMLYVGTQAALDWKNGNMQKQEDGSGQSVRADG